MAALLFFTTSVAHVCVAGAPLPGRLLIFARRLPATCCSACSGKVAKDLLSKDYDVGKTKVEVKMKTSNGVTFTPIVTAIRMTALL